MKYGDISHFSHPQHNLKFEYSDFPFKCDGCKEAGIGSHYKCPMCNFDLHMHCALPSPSINHPFYIKCSFQFLSRPPGNTPRYCNACERDVAGFVYHCKDCGFDLHPCCAKLPMVLHDGEVKLNLYRKVSASCQKCGRKGRSWSYRSECKKYNLHVACVKDMLVDAWHNLYNGRPNYEVRDYGFANPNYEVKGTRNRYGNIYSTTNLENRIPSLKNTVQTHNHKSKGKVKTCAEIAAMALQIVISAVLGDPTTLVAGIIGSLIKG